MRNTTCIGSGLRALRAVALAATLAGLLACVALVPRASATSTPSPPERKAPASVSLEQCVTSTEQANRSATFSGEMTAIPGSAKMEMRVDVLERQPREQAFRDVAAAGLGVWRMAAPGVKSFKYLKQVTNLAAPAYYRGAIHFRWINAKGKLIKATELRTARCLQTVQVVEEPAAAEGLAKST